MDEQDELQERYAQWVAALIADGRVWYTGEGEHNVVLEDPHEDRDLNVLFTSREAAAEYAEEGHWVDASSLEDLPELLDRMEGRGEGLALWHGDRWIVAEPGPLAEELRDESPGGA